MTNDLLRFRHLRHELNPHLLILIERRLVVAPVVELGGARGGVGGHRLRVFQRAVALKVIGDSGCAHRMIADARFDACVSRAPLNHPVAVLLCHAVWPAGETSGRAKQRPVLVVPDARCRDVCVEIRFQLWHARRFVFLAAFFVQAHPSAPSLAEIIPDVHLQHRADAGERVDHNADKRAVAQARESACVYRGEQSPCFLAVEHWRAAFGYDMPGSAHRVRRVHFDDLADDEPVKEHPDRGQVLFYGGFRKSFTEALDIARDMHRFHVRQIVHAVFRAEFREPAGGIEVSPPCMFILDIRGEEIEEPLRRPRLFEKQGRGATVSGHKVRRSTDFHECGARCHFIIRTISESSTSSCRPQFTCCAAGSVSLLRIAMCRCASATLRAPFSRWCMVSLKDLPPPA